MVWCTTLKVLSHCFNFTTYLNSSVVTWVYPSLTMQSSNFKHSLHFWSLLTGGFRLLKTESSQTPFEQCSFHPGWLGYAGDYTTQLFRDNKHLEPKWPLFWLEKALFWGVDLQKQRSFGFQAVIRIPIAEPAFHDMSLVGFDHCSFAFRFFRQGSDEFPPWLFSEQKKIRRRSTERQGDFTGRNGLDAFTWPDPETKCAESGPVVWWLVLGPGFHVVLGCPVGS